MPPELQQFDPGTDSFGVPYMSVTRHQDKKDTSVTSNQTRSHGLPGKMHFVTGDPNVKSFYVFYLPNSGTTVEVGKGLANRVYQKYIKPMDILKAQMDAIVNEKLKDSINPDGATESIYGRRAAQIKELLADDKSDYYKKQKQVDEVPIYTSNATYQYVYSRMHPSGMTERAFTCTLIRIQHWFDHTCTTNKIQLLQVLNQCQQITSNIQLIHLS